MYFMRYSSAAKLFITLVIGSIFASSCKHDKDIKKKPFKIRTDTWYRIAPVAPFPIVVNGITYSALAYFPGGGTGNASHMGAFTTFFNQLTSGTSPEAPPAGSVAVAIKDVPSYPITGAPLPLIQAGDFTELSSAISTLNIPETVYQKLINQVLYNKKGDAIFISAINGTGGTFPISDTKVGFNGKALIVTGRGKFSHATGEVDYYGYYNVADASDAEYNADGWIDY